MKLRNRTAALLAIPALTLALAACSDNEDTTVVTDAPAETKVKKPRAKKAAKPAETEAPAEDRAE